MMRERACVIYVFGGASRRGVWSDSVQCLDVSSGSWETLPDKMPFRGVNIASAKLRGRICLFGLGMDDWGGQVVCFDPTLSPESAWTIITRAQQPHLLRRNPAAAVLRGKLYLCGGMDPNSIDSTRTVECYDPRGFGRWHVLPSMHEPRACLICVPFGGKLLVAGGHAGERADLGIGKRSAELYSPDTAVWEPAPPMLQGRFSHCASIVRRGVCVCGGLEAMNGPTALCSAEMLLHGSDTWAALPPMQVPRTGHAASTAGPRIYVCGGNSPDIGVHSSVECFDPEKGVWETLSPMLLPRTGAAAAAIAG